MTMYTRNYPNRDKKAIFFYTLFLAVFLFSLLINPAYSNPAFVINASDSTGEWSRGVITNREVIFTTRPLIKSEFNVYISSPGKYQLFAYLNHNWRRNVACIYVEAIDDKGVLYKGYHRIENIWYLDKDYPGRWFCIFG